MNPQATRRTADELRILQASRRTRGIPQPPAEPFDWVDAAGFAVIAIAWVIFVACLACWWLGIDSWAVWALAPIAWGKPDRIAGRMVCESIERTMPHTPWRWERPHGWTHGAACAGAWLLIAFLLIGFAALAAAK